MYFTLEAFQADHGDALLLHFGPADDPRTILIDGGPTAIGYHKVIKPRLQEIREGRVDEIDDPLRLDMVMVSHIDDDHIVGVQALFKELQDSDDDQTPAPWLVETLWFNSFDEILGNGDAEIFSELTSRVAAAGVDAPLPGVDVADPYGAAVIASVPNGRRLRHAALGLATPLNAPFNGLVMAKDSGATKVTLDHGLTLTIIAPSAARVEALHEKWEQSLEQQPNLPGLANIAANADVSVANLSSIVVLAELEGKTMLLTGDARSDHILDGLESAGLLSPGDAITIDILKLPHHGSDRNVTKKFFQRVKARHYVVSANGKHDNPDLATLVMIEAARDDSEDFTIHLTNHSGENNLAEILDNFFDTRSDRGRSYRVSFREDSDDDAPSLWVDLLDELDF